MAVDLKVSYYQHRFQHLISERDGILFAVEIVMLTNLDGTPALRDKNKVTRFERHVAF